MKTAPKLRASLIAAAALFPLAAAAEIALTTQGVNMRAGPDVSYPQVAFLGRGLRVNVMGCTEGWQWCDVIAGPNRGWVYAGYLSYSYYNQPTIISYAGPTLGLPLVSFAIGPYWDNYYRGRPWWNNRSYWYNHRVAPPPAWRGPPGRDWHRDDQRGRGYPVNDRYQGRRDDHRGDARLDDRRDNRGGPRPNGNRPDPAPRPNDQFHPNEQQ